MQANLLVRTPFLTKQAADGLAPSGIWSQLQHFIGTKCLQFSGC